MPDKNSNSAAGLFAVLGVFAIPGAILGSKIGSAASPAFHAMPPELATTLRVAAPVAGVVGGAVALLGGNLKTANANNILWGCGGFVLAGFIMGLGLGFTAGTFADPVALGATLDAQTAHIQSSIAALNIIPSDKLPEAVAQFKAEFINAANLLSQNPRAFFASLPQEALANPLMQNAAAMLKVDISSIHLPAIAKDAAQSIQAIS